MTHPRIIPIVLAGGIGQRLWPLSTPEKPKQFIPFSNGSSLYQNTLARLAPLSTGPMTVVTNQQHAALATEQADGRPITVLAEPCGRNTAAAIAYATLTHQQHPDAVLVITPADHFVQNQEAFAANINLAVKTAATSHNLVLLGAHPTYPATGFGYIQTVTEAGCGVRRVKSFHEKPTLDRATLFVTAGTYWWNTGMVVARVDSLLAEFTTHAPDIMNQVQQFMHNQNDYAQVPNISFDHAVLEKSTNCWMVPASFSWHDVGTLDTFVELSQSANSSKTNMVQLHGSNNRATGTGDKLVVCMGLSNVTIVQTDTMLLVLHQQAGQDMRSAAQHIQTLLTQGPSCNP